jgi:hypothetical protein
MRQAFDRAIKQGFVDMDYRSPNALWDVKTIKLAPEARPRLMTLIGEYSNAVMRLAEEFRPAVGAEGEWVSMLIAIRTVDPRELRGPTPRL